MKQRVLSGVLICAVLAVFIGFSGFPVVLKAVTAAISACALYEVLVVTKYVESKTLMVISLLFAIAIPFFPDFQRAGFTGGIFIFAVILFTSLICLYKTFSFEHLCVVFVMSIIIPFFFSCIIYTRQISDTLGLYYMLMIFLCAWATDTGGYIFGRLFGRHRMTPVISPKKTIEGAVGGYVASAAALAIVAYAAHQFTGANVNFVSLCVFALFGSSAAILGDLTASVIKRSFGAKDYGNLIPGHGGIMDRFDSVLFVAPTLYLYYHITVQILQRFGFSFTIFSL